METTKRKRGWLDRAVPILLAAAMALQISAGGLVARAADAAPDGGGAGTAQGEPASGASAPQAREAGENLLTNPEFSKDENNTVTGWELFGTYTFNDADPSYTFTINGAANDREGTYSPGLAQAGITGLDPKYQYNVSFDVVSTVARPIIVGFEGTGFDDARRELDVQVTTPDVKQTLECTTSKFGSGGKLVICLGLEEKDFPKDGEGNLITHTVTISNIKLVKGDRIEVEGEDLEPGEKPAVEQTGNLLTDGDFAAGSDAAWKTDNYLSNNGVDVYFNQYRTVFYFKSGADNYQQGLKQPFTFAPNKIYDVTMVVQSDQARTISLNFHDINGKGGAYYISDPLTPNKVETLKFTTDGFGNDNGSFWLYLGLNNRTGEADKALKYPHKLIIYGLSVTEHPLDDTENDPPYPDVTSIKDIGPSDAFALPEGNWITYTKPDGAQATFEQPADGSVTVNITNSGSQLADVRFGKYIDLKANLTYTLSFDVLSDKERSFNVSITDEAGHGSKEFYKPIAVRAGVKRPVVLQIPTRDKDSNDELFRFYLGKYLGEPGNNTTSITFSNIKLEVLGYREMAELIGDGDFTAGLGGFTKATAEGTTIEVHNHSVVARVAGGLMPASTFAAPRAGGNTLSRAISNMEEGAQYEVSFVAGAVKPCTLSVAMPDGQTQEYRLTGEARAFSYSFTADQAAGELAFDFGTEQNTICLDTVRLDVRGYTKAAGIDTAANDISELTSQEPPVITEMALATFGETVRMKFPHVASEYKNSITGITLNGTPLTAGSFSDGSVTGGDYYISDNSGNWHYIYLRPGLFTEPEDGDRAAYEIVVKADFFEDNVAHQIVYKPGVFNKVTLTEDFAADALNTDLWGYQEGNGTAYGLWGWGNNEQQWYTRDNVTVEDGVLKITAGPCSGEVADHEGSSYHSGRIWTKVNGKGGLGFAQTYGRFEAKIKLPAGEEYQGLWPAFWLLPEEGADYYGGWPVSGEIDIMEARCREPYTMDGTLHFGSPGNDSPIGSHYNWKQDDGTITGSIAEYHIYSVDWTPTYISFQMDGREYVRYENWWSRADGEPMDYAYPAPFDRPFYIILNMAVGGDYDGGRNPSMTALPADMLVDYVRVYQYNDSDLKPDEIVSAPGIPVDPILGTAKTGITDPNFTQVHKATDDNMYDRTDKNDWYLLTLSDFGGQASSSTAVNDGDTFLKVDVTSPGSAAHAVQLIQHLDLYQGNWYTLSFDAYAEQPRDINAKIASDGSTSWSSYNESVAALGTEPQRYEYTFQMRAATDLNSRLEINLGGAAGPVYIGNVTFQNTEAPTVDYNGPKAPLENGEGIYNGRFDLGDRLTYWNAVGGEVVKKQAGNAYEYCFKAGAGGATLTQKGIQLLPTDSYRLEADITGGVTYAFQDAEGNNILTGTLEGTQTITVPAGARYDDAQIVFTLSGGAELDNISLVRTTFNNVDYEGKDAYPLFNGDFEAGTEGWDDHWNCGFNIGIEGSSKYAVLSQYQGGAGIYEAGLTHSNVHLYGGYTYELSFRAKAKPEGQRPVMLMTRLAGQENIYGPIGTSWEEQTFRLKPSDDMDTTLNFFFGAYEENGVSYNGWGAVVYLDDVEIKMLGAPEKPGTLTPDSYNRLGEDVSVSLSGPFGWIQTLVPVLNGKVLSDDSYRIENDRLVLDRSLFSEVGEYTLSARAEDYADSRQAAIRVYPANGDLIFNGGVENGGAGWEYYASGSKNSVAYAGGQMTAHYAELTVDNGSYVPWGIQWNQKITVPADGGYTLRFTASADVDRYIMVGLKDSAKQMVSLEKGTQECTVSLNLSAGNPELQFWMGAVNPDRENGYFTSADIPFIPSVYSTPHSVSLSGVSLLPQNAKYTSITLTGNTKVTLGESATITAALVDESGQAVSGTVGFYLDDRQLPSANNTLTLGRDVLASAGTYVICAVYDGDDGHVPARRMFTVTVTAAGSETSGGSSGAGGGIIGGIGGSGGSSYNVGNGNGSSPGGSWSVDKSTARENDLVTITVKPNAGMAAGIPEVSGPKGESILVRELGDGTFGFTMPDGAVIVGVKFSPEKPANPFVDVPGDEYYYDAVLWAVANGITIGTDSTHFSPSSPCTRAQIVTFLWRANGKPSVEGVDNPFVDVDPAATPGDYYEAILWAVSNGITTGTDGTHFSPNAACTRAQAMTFLWRSAGRPAASGGGFSDVDGGAYYADAVSWAVSKGVTTGTGGGRFSPNAICIRAQIVTFLYRDRA